MAASLVSLPTSKMVDLVPELKTLQGIVENNAWHNQDDVLMYTLTVVERLKVNLDLPFITNDQTKLKIFVTLNQVIGELTRRDLLLWAGLFHDFGKPETISRDDKQTICPDHEIVGANKAAGSLSAYIPNETDRNWIVGLIQNHGLPHRYILEDIPSLQQESADMYPELLLLGLSDTEASQAAELIPVEFKRRVSRYYMLLNQL